VENQCISCAKAFCETHSTNEAKSPLLCGPCENEIFSDEDRFNAFLHATHLGLRTPILKVPTLGGKDLNLLELRMAVERFGGIVRVTQRKMFKTISRKMKLPSTITNSSTSLRKHFTRYLMPFNLLLEQKSSPTCIDMETSTEEERDVEAHPLPVVAKALYFEPGHAPPPTPPVLCWIIPTAVEKTEPDPNSHCSAFRSYHRVESPREFI